MRLKLLFFIFFSGCAKAQIQTSYTLVLKLFQENALNERTEKNEFDIFM